MAYINIANNLNTKTIYVDVIGSSVRMLGEDFELSMDRYDAFELGRMLQSASKKLMLERTID